MSVLLAIYKYSFKPDPADQVVKVKQFLTVLVTAIGGAAVATYLAGWTWGGFLGTFLLAWGAAQAASGTGKTGQLLGRVFGGG